jgi:hypothetical protein
MTSAPRAGTISGTGTRGEPRSNAVIVPFGSQSSSAQDPDSFPLLEESGLSSGSIHTNASEPSLSDLGARARPRNPNRGFEAPDALSRSDINRTTGRTRDKVPLPSHAPRDAPEPDSP